MENDSSCDSSEELPRVPALTGDEEVFLNPDFCLSMAQSEHASGNLTQALEFYVDYLTALPSPQDIRLMDLESLTDMVILIGRILEERVECVVKCFTQILNLLPDNAKILNALGVYLFGRGELRAAKTYLTKAVEAGYLAPEKSLLHVIWEIIPRWHFRMLNDVHRNSAYKKAIETALDQQYRDVVDIGTGCGLLTTFVMNHCPEATVTAYEEKQTLVKIASQVFSDNNKDHKVKLVQANSNRVRVDKPSSNLLITEIFDSGFFGENCIATIHHSLFKHLVPNDSPKTVKVIPSKATLYLTAISCPKLAEKHRFINRFPDILSLVNLRDRNCEPYDCEYLQREPVKYLSNTVSFMHVDFLNAAQLRKVAEGCYNINTLNLECKESGVIDGLAFWFDLELDEDTTISTKPTSEKTCWEQAVFYIDPLKVSQNETIAIKPLLHNPPCLSFRIVTMRSSYSPYLLASREFITFLNDRKLVECVHNFANTFNDCKGLRVVDLNPFPLFGLLMAKKEATVYHVYREKCDVKVIRALMQINKINANCMKLLLENNVDIKELQNANVVYTNFVDTDGSWIGPSLRSRAVTYPRKIIITTVLIHSDYLDFCNKVNENNVFGSGIAKYINEYSGWEHPDIDIETFDYVQLSEITSLDISDFRKQNFDAPAKVIAEGAVNGILYWFKFGFTDDIVFDTRDSSYYNKTCTFMGIPKIVNKNDFVNISVIREGNYMKVTC